MLSLQLIMLYGLVVIGIIYVTATSSLAVRAQDIERQAVPRSRCPFIRNSLVNGRVKIRSRGRIAKFICNNGYELVGRRFATCVRGQWNNPIPICVTNGCPVINHPANGELNVEISDALVTFSCDAGYVLRGSSTVYCTGTAWNDTVPVCDIATTSPELTCDFEDPNICGWSHDRYHNFDWRRHQFSTPSGHVGTGPSYDHTLGKNNDGYYMYTEASPPRVVNDSARLFSPVYFPETTPACFVFWYHMYGATTGSLRVYLKKESQVFKELLPAWEKIGPQGNLWLQGYLPIPESKQNFQIVIEGIRGTGYVGDTAIDDVALYSTPCEDLVVANINRGADSCKNRCFSDEEVNATCSCKQGCEDVVHWCCDDYEYFCTDSANRTDVGLFSTEPSLKRTSNPSGTSLSSIETFAEATSTPESTFTPIINTSETVIPTSLNLSSNTIYQTAKAQSSSTTATSQTELSNETISVTSSSKTNFPPPLPKEPSSTVVNVSLSTKELVSNTTASQIATLSPTTAIIEETMPKGPSINSTLPSTTKKKVVIPLPSVNSSPPTTAAPVVKSTTTSSKSPTAGKLTTNAASTTRSTTSLTSTTASTIPQLTTSNRILPPRVLTPASTTKSTLTSQFTPSKQSTTFSTRLTSFVKDRQSISTESSSSVSIKTTSSILDKRTSTGRFSKLSTTSKQYTIATPTTSKPSTFSYYKTTKSYIQRMSSVTTSQRKITTTITTSTPSTSVLKTSFNYPKQNNSVVLQDKYSPRFTTTAFQSPSIIPSSTSAPEIRTSENCPEGSLRFRNGRCFPPWTNNVYSSQAVVTGSTELLETSTLASKITNTPLQLTELINTKVPNKLKTYKPFPSSTRNPGVVYESSEVFSTWKPDFKSRTKYRTYIQNPSEKSPVSITMIVALAVCVISALALIVIVGLYIFCKKRKVEQSKLSEDSEMRFLSDCEIIEFADASTKLHADSA